MEGGQHGADYQDQESIAAFMEIVGGTADKAREFLQATNWQLEEAIQLFYAGDEPLTHTAQTDSNIGGSSAVAAAPSVSEQGDDYVRPPLPVKREALYEDIFQYRAHHMAQTSNQPSSVDAFRNFQEEAHFRAQASANGVTSADAGKDSLAALYRPPFGLMFQGSFEQAKVEASKQGKWLLVNLQSTKEFSSYTLNRDTWAHETVKDMIQTVFVFWQAYDDTEEGQKVCTYYKLTKMPSIMIVDPLTGQRMRSWEGMVGAERLLEDLVPYMDRGPLEQKPIPPPKRPRESSYMSVERPKANPDMYDQITQAAISDSNTKSDEYEQLQRAVIASLEDTNLPKEKAGQKNADPMQDENIQTDKRLPDTKPDYPPLPEEPTQSDATVCRVAIRLPDGTRGQRKFLRSDPIQVLWSFCCSKVSEAANGKAFRITTTIPGIAGGSLDYKTQTSIGDAGLANSMLVMTWD